MTVHTNSDILVDDLGLWIAWSVNESSFTIPDINLFYENYSR